MQDLIHEIFSWASIGIPAFAVVIGVVIFIHELGHFLVGRACGVGVKTFSIGFGPEIFGWTDSKGTRWKLSWIPLGGYVMFEGDANAASMADAEALAKMTDEQRKRALPSKPLWQRAAVSAAGPFANFVLAFVVFTAIFAIAGARTPGTYVGAVSSPSPAAEAGIKPGDRITAIDGKTVRTFIPDLTNAIQGSTAKTLMVTFERDGKTMTVPVTPRILNNKDLFGAVRPYRAIGVGLDEVNTGKYVRIPISLAEAPVAAAIECWSRVDLTLTYLWRIVSHRADASGLGGPIRIAKVAKSAASNGIYDVVWLLAVISVSIGLINLFPIPLLDGGHLLYYACEAVLGRPLPERIQNAGFAVGLLLVVSLMVFATWNDLVVR